jgi:hypothetical protein
MQVNGVSPTSYPQSAYGPSYGQPVTYTPNNPYSPDMYNSNPMNPTQQQPQQPKQYVTKQSVAMGLAGAGIGFLIAGPMGALIGGVGALLLGIIMNLFSKPAQSQVPPQAQGQQYAGQPQQQQYYQYPQQGAQAPQQYQSNYNPYQQMKDPYGRW